VRRYALLLSGLDAAVHERSASWQRAVWAATIERTQLDELGAAKDALMRSLVEVSSHARRRRARLLAAALSAAVDAWRAAQQQAR
jgi:hypothetical protein